MINQIIIEGRVTHTPELITRSNGTLVVQATIANHKDNNNEKANFIDVTFFNTYAKNFAKYIKKGDKVVVIGNLETSNYTDKNGINRKSTTVICEKVYYPPKTNSEDYSEDIPIPTE